ncbi:MAG: Fe-S cluster assembly protein SufD [Ignavibacterium sp.]|nr:Fe-S cluster assembly protein SufD [Ignavibacterium sp.]
MNKMNFKEIALNNFLEFERNLNGEKDLPIHSFRKKSFEYFNTLDLPTIKNEEWKYTNVSFLNNEYFKISNQKLDFSFDHIQKFLFDNLEHSLITLVNGFFNKNLSKLLDIPKGVEIISLAEALKLNHPIVEKYLGKISDNKDNFFTSLNTSFINDGVFIYIPDGKIIEDPIHIIFYQNSIQENNLVQPRNLFVIGKNSQVSIIEHYVSDTDTKYFTNSVTEIFVDENGILDHIRLQEESLQAVHIGRMDVNQERYSNFSSHLISTGAKFSRNEFNTRFIGQGGESTLNGLFMIDGEQLFDAHTLIDHAQPNCNSHEHYKGILQGNSRGVFNGKVMVRPDAQKTNAFQENNTILLSESATMNSKPQLEIFADDVKCSHGATVGKLNEEAMFYLKTRGIGQEAATAMLIHAFASDVITSIKIEALRDYLEKIITRKFN